MIDNGPTAEWLAERNAAGHMAKPISKPRIERALVREQSPLVIPLRKLKELLRPVETGFPELITSENDNANPGVGFEVIHNQGCISPSVPALLRAFADGQRTRVVSYRGKIVGRVQYRVIDSFVEIGGALPDGFHGLQFFRGELVAYGIKGKKRRPAYIANKQTKENPRSASATVAHLTAIEQENRKYLSLPSGESYRPTTGPDAPRSIAQPLVIRDQATQECLRAVAANDNVPVTRLPDGVAAQYGRLAGISDATGKSSPRHPSLAEIDRKDQQTELTMTGRDAEIVEAILDNESFRTIGLRFGYAESSAHRMGRRLVERALTEISRKLAA